MSLASLAHGSTRGSWRDVASFPHIKQDPPDWRVQSEQSLWKQALRGAERAKSLKKAALLGAERAASLLSGPLNRLNAILSLLLPLDRYRTPSAIGSAIGRPLSRPISHPNTGGSPQPPRSKPLGGLNRAIVV